MRWLQLFIAAALFATVLPACGLGHDLLSDGGAPPDAGGRPVETDAGSADGGLDAGVPDSGSAADGGSSNGDAGSPDSGPLDSGMVDAGVNDAGGVDSGTADSGVRDAGVDAGPVDAGSDGGRPDAGLLDGGVLDAGADSGIRDAGGLDGGDGGSGGDGGAGFGVYGRNAMAAFDALSAPEKASIRNIRVFFHHHSVGENIMGEWTDTTPAGHVPPPGGAASLGFPFSPANSAGAYTGALRLGENTGGANGDPAAKLASFADFIDRQGFGDAVDVAIFKFCYLDFASTSNVNTMAGVQALEATYRNTMAGIKARHPNLRIIHITVPLNNYWNYNRNDLRAEMGRFMRAEYGADGFVFDLQNIETFAASGPDCAHGGIPVACDPYIGGTGHLTDFGANNAAKGLLYTILRADQAP